MSFWILISWSLHCFLCSFLFKAAFSSFRFELLPIGVPIPNSLRRLFRMAHSRWRHFAPFSRTAHLPKLQQESKVVLVQKLINLLLQMKMKIRRFWPCGPSCRLASFFSPTFEFANKKEPIFKSWPPQAATLGMLHSYIYPSCRSSCCRCRRNVYVATVCRFGEIQGYISKKMCDITSNFCPVLGPNLNFE